MLRFAQPEMSLLLLAVVPLIGLAWLISVRQRFRSTGLPRRGPRRRRSMLRLAGPGLTLLGAAALTAALMQPQVWMERQDPVYERPDLILVLDRSLSMQATDLQPARLHRAAQEIKQLLEGRGQTLGRVGLVTFSATSVILSYLTTDRDNIIFYLDWLVEEPSLLFGTNIGAALASAREVAERDESSTPKLFILLSDGEDFGGQLAAEAARFGSRDWKIHTIGLGSEGAVPIPLPATGEQRQYLRDERQQVVFTEFNEATLRSVAQSTGGLYLRSTSGGELAGALSGILDSQVRIIDWETTGEYRDVHRWALLIASAALLMLVAVL